MKSLSATLLLVFAVATGQSAKAAPATGTQGMVATVHPVATDAGVAAMKQGGNAVDAAIAAAFMLGVVDGHNSGIGGGCFILIRTADAKLVAIDGRETAPAKATRNMYLSDGEPVRGLSTTGPLAVGTPGALAAYAHAVENFGALPLRQHILPAAETAENGFQVDRVFAGRLKLTAPTLARFPGTRSALLHPDGTSYQQGQLLKLPDLAETYRSIAAQGPTWFYQGKFAEQVGSWMESNGGILRAEDFRKYQVRRREPVQSTYRGYQIVGFPPPSSGGVHVAQILNVLAHFKLSDLDEADYVHVAAEAMKLAFADRAHWLGDPDFAKVPRGLVDKQYAEALARRIDVNKTSAVKGHGMPPKWQEDLFGKHTTHIAAADTSGNWVAITTTVNTPFGSKLIVPGTGVILNNQMDDFSVQPGVPNIYGLIGAEANAIAPGKRPLSSMSPTIVLKDGKPVLTLGAAGGPRIISQVVLAITHGLDRDMSLPDALGAPRFHQQWRPKRLFVEKTLPLPVIGRLNERGHEVHVMPYVGVTQAIGLAEDGKTFIGLCDPRVPGKAAGF